MKKFSRKFSLEPRVDYSMSVATELERQLSHITIECSLFLGGHDATEVIRVPESIVRGVLLQMTQKEPRGNTSRGETFIQDDTVMKLSHTKMLRRLREMNEQAAAERLDHPATMDSILQRLTDAKEQHRELLRQVQQSEAIQTNELARQARLQDHKPYPHPRPWNNSPLLDPDRERRTPEAVEGDPFLEWQEIKRVRKIEAEQHPSWKYPSGDRAFGEPPLYCCTDKFKRTLEAHLKQAIAKIASEYKDMPDGTLRQSNLKADVGAELWLMQSSLDEVQRGLKKAHDKEKRRRMIENSRPR